MLLLTYEWMNRFPQCPFNKFFFKVGLAGQRGESWHDKGLCWLVAPGNQEMSTYDVPSKAVMTTPPKSDFFPSPFEYFIGVWKGKTVQCFTATTKKHVRRVIKLHHEDCVAGICFFFPILLIIPQPHKNHCPNYIPNLGLQSLKLIQI